MKTNDITLLSGFHRISLGLWVVVCISGKHLSTIIPTQMGDHSRTPATMSHLSELIEGQLQAAFVVGGPIGCDFLHGLLQHPLVAHVGLHQVLEAGGVRGLAAELERGQKEGGRGRVGKWRGGTCTYFFFIKYVARFETESCRVSLNAVLNRFHSR